MNLDIFYIKMIGLLDKDKLTKLNDCQSKLDFPNSSISFFKPTILGYRNPNRYNLYTKQKIGLSEVSRMEMDYIVPASERVEDRQWNKEKGVEDIIRLMHQNQKKISEYRGRPVISYITAIDSRNYPSDSINISEDDTKSFVHLIKDLPEDIVEVDVILHSNGGYTVYARKIVELLRNRFQKVNYLIPYAAYSSAAMMTMSADEIIMTPESCLGPFDVSILSPDGKVYLPALEMKKCAKEAKQANNPWNVFVAKSLYKDWDGLTIRRIMYQSDQAVKLSKSYPLYWLMKYMFKSYGQINFKLASYIVLPWWKKLSKNGRKANRIVDFFTNTEKQISHDNPIMFNDIKDCGLKVSLSDNTLTEMLRETYALADILFENSKIAKLYVNSNDKAFFFSPNKNTSHIERES